MGRVCDYGEGCGYGEEEWLWEVGGMNLIY